MKKLNSNIGYYMMRNPGNNSINDTLSNVGEELDNAFDEINRQYGF